jgi:hypothetical protein
MMINYHSHPKNTHNFKIKVFEILKNSKYNFKTLFKFQKSFAIGKWVIMCMTYEQSCDLWLKKLKFNIINIFSMISNYDHFSK